MIRKLVLAFAAVAGLLALAAILFGQKTVKSSLDVEVAAWSNPGCAATALASDDAFLAVPWGLGNTRVQRQGRPRNTHPSERAANHSSLIVFPESRYFEDSVASPAWSRVGTCVLRC